MSNFRNHISFCVSLQEHKKPFFFLPNKINLEPGVGAEHTQFSEKGGGRANEGLPSKMVETQGDFLHRILALEGL